MESNSGISVILRSLLLNQSFNCFICSEIDLLGLLDGPGEDGEGAHVALSERVPLERERDLEVVGFATGVKSQVRMALSQVAPYSSFGFWLRSSSVKPIWLAKEIQPGVNQKV